MKFKKQQFQLRMQDKFIDYLRLDFADGTTEYKMMISLMLNIKLQWVVAVVILENLIVIFTTPGLSKV